MANPWDSDPPTAASSPWENDPPASPQASPITAGGLYKAADVGMARGLAGIIGAPRAIGSAVGAGMNLLSRATGLKEVFDPSKPSVLPTAEGTMQSFQKDFYGGAIPYQPQNMPERFAQSAGEMLPNALIPGGAITRAANVVLPAIGSQTAAELGAGPVGQFTGGLAGGAGAAKLGRAIEAATTPSLKWQDAKDAAQTIYDAVEKAGIATPTTPSLTQNLAYRIEQVLHAQNFRPNNAPETYAEIEKIRNPGTNKATDIGDLLTVRQNLRKISGPDGLAAKQAEKMVTQLIDQQVPGSTNAIGIADQNYNSAKIGENLSKRTAKAELGTASTYSGMNLGNKLRQMATSVVNSPQAKFMKAEDIDALTSVANGTATQNIMRWAANALGGGHGLYGGALGLGGAYMAEKTGNPEWLIPMGLGLGLKMGYNRSVANQAAEVAKRALSRSPQAQAIGAHHIPRLGLLGAGVLGARNTLPGLLGQYESQR